MKQSLLIGALTITAFAVVGFAAEPPTRWEWMLRVLEEKETSRVKYCGEHFPSMKATLEADNQRYKTLLRQAAASLQDKVSANPEYAKPIDQKLVELFADVPELQVKVLSMSKDLAKDCAELQAALLRPTYESLRKEFQASMDKMPTPTKQSGPSQ